MLAAHDSNQRAVGGVGLEFVPVARGHDGKVAPEAEFQLPAEVQGPAAAVVAQGRMESTLAVQDADLGGARVLPLRENPQNAPVPSDELRPCHFPRPLARAGPIEGPAVVPLGVEYGDGLRVRIPRHDRVARPGLHVSEAHRGELPGAFALATPLGQVRAGSVEHPQLTRGTVGHEDPSVGQLRGVPGVAEQVGILAIDVPDRDVRLRPDHPVQPRTLFGTGVFDDADARAVPAGVKAGRSPQIFERGNSSVWTSTALHLTALTGVSLRARHRPAPGPAGRPPSPARRSLRRSESSWCCSPPLLFVAPGTPTPSCRNPEPYILTVSATPGYPAPGSPTWPPIDRGRHNPFVGVPFPRRDQRLRTHYCQSQLTKCNAQLTSISIR